MIPEYLSAAWPAGAMALANHLWQSTLFAAAAGLLTLALRQNRAGARYWLWLAASVKFLLPFSLLTALGNNLSWLRGPAANQASLYVVVEQISQPFAQPGLMARAAPAATFSGGTLFPVIVATWLAGFLAVLLVWYVRWRRICATLRQAQPLREGREWQALSRAQRRHGLPSQIDLFLSQASLEPGIFGVVRPVMVWPAGISSHLEDAHLEAILAHELWHVRRRDNLAAAVHMLVEAIFWFHPLVWWLGARLVDERERACDEQVVELGGEPQVYAESILKVCEFCVGSPLACVAGVTGADLKKRIVHIMTRNVIRKLNVSKKLLITAAGLIAIALPLIFGVMHPTAGRAESVAGNAANPYAYTVTSLKPSVSSGKNQMARMLFTPDGFDAKGLTLKGLIKVAYKVEDNQISGAPDWLDSQRFDLEATVDKAAAAELKKLPPEQTALMAQRMLQSVLAEKFQLVLHAEAKELPVYSLVVTEGGAKLQEAKPGDTYPNGLKGPDGVSRPGMMRIWPGALEAQALPASGIADFLSGQTGTKVFDKTGLTGKYDFKLHWKSDESHLGTLRGPGSADPLPVSEVLGSSLLGALQEQLGLDLKPEQAQVQILAIDHVEKPSE